MCVSSLFTVDTVLPSLFVSTRRRQDGRIEHVELHKEVPESFVSYALSVLLGRALPDARDGLKPVHRRIL